jgi:starch phosphorylase
MVDLRHSVEQKWSALHFGPVKLATKEGQYIFEVQVCLQGLDPKTVRVELYADGIKGGDTVRQEMTLLHPLADEAGSYIYSATVSVTRSPGDYTARLLPHYEGVAIPLEDSRIVWQR